MSHRECIDVGCSAMAEGLHGWWAGAFFGLVVGIAMMVGIAWLWRKPEPSEEEVKGET